MRVRFLCTPDEESEEVEDRSTDVLVRDGLRGDFAITGEPTDLHIGVQSKGVLFMRIAVDGHGRPRLDALARRQRGAQGRRRVPARSSRCRSPRVFGAVRPPVDQPRPHLRRGRRQQGARPVHDGRRRPLPPGPGPRRDPRADRGARATSRCVRLQPRAGDGVAHQRLRARAARGGRRAVEGEALERRARRRVGRDLLPRGRASRRSSSGRSAAGTTGPRSGSRSPRWPGTGARWVTSWPLQLRWSEPRGCAPGRALA